MGTRSVIALTLLLAGCTSHLERDGNNVLLACVFPCLLFMRDGTLKADQGMCPAPKGWWND
jgi:hypothetical protein